MRHTKKIVLPLIAVLIVAVLAGGYVLYLDYLVTRQFANQTWQLPSRVYARPLELFVEKKIKPNDLSYELNLLQYHSNKKLSKSGQFIREGSRFFIYTRGFDFPDQIERERKIYVEIDNTNTVTTLVDANTREDINVVRLDPIEVGAIYPAKNEDRILMQLHESPELLTKGLISIEDRHFYSHDGIDYKAIVRAVFANIEAGSTVQGGSTLTQQLVKNFFLTNEKSFVRKINEAIMALLLEYHFPKKTILEAYLNEVYLGQAGKLEIHGFALAARFYFKKKIDELEVSELALIVGLVRGPSYYDPRRYPDRALARRNLVLSIWRDAGLIDKARYETAFKKPLGVTPDKDNGLTNYPSYLQLVKQQLEQQYDENALRSEGYRLYTSFDPIVQSAIESGVTAELGAIERDLNEKDHRLEIAVVVTHTASGEVVGMLGSRDNLFGAFNRALDARRPIGSLVKPAVYLTALEHPDRYNLATILDDSPLVIEDHQGKVWAPKNYDNEFHDTVPLYEAFAHSYNIASVRLGMEVGLDNVVGTLHRLGYEGSVSPLPSLPLGAIEMSPYEVTQIYQTIASGGFRTPLRALNSVVDKNLNPLNRYNIVAQQVIDEEYAYLITVALQNVAQIGTARGVYASLPMDIAVAGKTGTTNDLRDSWFAGFTGDYLMIVWVGHDDNSTTRLTGSSGALRVWRRIMEKLSPAPLVLPRPKQIVMARVDTDSGNRIGEECDEGVEMPFVADHVPPMVEGCGTVGGKVVDWLRQFFQ